MSLAVPVSVYQTVKEAIKQHTSVRYINRLRWTPLNLCPQQTISQFYSSKARRPFTSQVHFVAVAAFWVQSVDSDEDVWGKEEFVIYRVGEDNFIWQNDKKNPTNA
jgi:hypothetical protein